MNTDHDVRELLERMASEPAIGPVDPEPILRRAHRRLARTAVLGFACLALLAGVAIGGANLVLSSPSVPATPNPTDSDLPSILRDGEVLIQNFGSGQLEAFDPSTGDRRAILDCVAEDCGRINGYEISADGRWLAYYLWCRVSCPPGAGIWVTNALGDKHQLTGAGSGQPWAWSPQGSTLAAFGEGDGLLTIDPRTGDRTTVASPSWVDALAWSPDGTDIVYTAAGLSPDGTVVNATAGLWSVDLESGVTTMLVHGVDGAIAWSPDGSQIAFSDVRGIIVMNRDGSDLHVLVDHGGPEGPGSPVWSPDGTEIAYEATPGETVGGQGQYSLEVWVIGVDGSNDTLLYRSRCCIGSWEDPIWSPDGSRIAFYKQLEYEPPFKLHGLGPYLVVNADGTGSHERIDATEVLSW